LASTAALERRRYGKVYPAKVVGTDDRTDVALIKVDGRSDFPNVKFAEQIPAGHGGCRHKEPDRHVQTEEGRRPPRSRQAKVQFRESLSMNRTAVARRRTSDFRPADV
jgi:hypothetical protein